MEVKNNETVFSHHYYPEHLRRICFKDTEKDNTLIFLTNNTTLPALTIAALYKSRWQVELFFKWIKQHLRIKRFYSTSENAVKTQIWTAVSICPHRHYQEKAQPQCFPLCIITDSLDHPFRENVFTTRTSDYRRKIKYVSQPKPVEFIHFLTGH